MSEPYYQRGGVTLYHADCRAVLPTLESGSIDAVVTDPPYGVDYKGKTTKHSREVGGAYNAGDDATVGPELISMWTGRAVVFPGIRLLHDYPKPTEIGFVYCPSGAGLGRWGFITGHPILYYGKCPYLAAGLGHRPNGFISFHTQEPNGHPCPKPVQWMEFAINKASVNEGETILDPFAGSGTTGEACIRLGRNFIGIELDEQYIEIAAKRLDRLLSEPRLPFVEEAKEEQRGLWT